MRGKVVWLLGMAGLVALGAYGLHTTLPGVESDVRAKVTRALSDKGLDDVQARVDGQTVTLTAMDNDPDSVRKLAEAKAAIAQINDGSKWAKVVAQIDVNQPPQSQPQRALAQVTPRAMPAAGAAPAADGPVAVDGERATSIDSTVSDRPAVAGAGPMPISSNAAQGCEERIYKAMGARKLAYVTGGYDLTSDSQPIIDDVYKVASNCPASLKLTVAGYTDNVGDAVANQLISKARAQAAADALIKRGLAADRVKVAGYGAASPIADNGTPEGRATNRRVVILVTED